MDGRKCIIYLPNDRKLDITVHNKQLGKDLWNTVVSELNLKEEDYFGLTYKTSGEHYAWLQDDKKVLDHDIDMKSTDFPLEFIFSVKCYEDSVTVHKHPTTVELIFLYVISQIYKEEIFVTHELSLELAAIALQAFYGDFTSDEKASADYKDLACLSRRVLYEVNNCEEQVISWYKNYCGISRGQAILLYMSKAEKLANYGVHFFKVKDKARTPWWLGISNKGIYQYNIDDKITPHTVFQWRNLENLYFREKKFSVEVCSGHKRSHSAGFTNNKDLAKKTGNSNNQSPKTHTWYGTPALIKSIWIMAIAQHLFYWDRKQSSKSKSQANTANASNLRTTLDKNSNSLIVPPQSDGHNMPRKGHHKNNVPATLRKGLPGHSNGRAVMVQPEQAQSPEMKAIENKMVDDLKKRKVDLEDRLYDKVQELKALCLDEYNITEKLPIEYLRYHRPCEVMPTLKKKIGTEFPVQLRKNPTRGNRHDTALADELQQLENDCNLLNQITKAAHKLAFDPVIKGRLKRKRLNSYKKSLKKLKDVENKIDELRSKQGREGAVRQSTFITTSDLDIMNAMKACSIDDKSERSSLSDGLMLEDETSVSSGAEALSTHSTPALSTLRPNSDISADIDMDDMTLQRSRTPPPGKTKVSWLESPHDRKKMDHHSPVKSYPVLQSPSSHRSATSSGTDTPPHQNHGWVQSKWDRPRNESWKVSSLDSLESIGSRRSSEQNISGSPRRHNKIPNNMNSNAMRIARASEANKVSLQEKHRTLEPSRRMGTVNPVLEIVQDTVPDNSKDSRTSLTDSGHGTDSRVQSCHEEEVLKQKLNANVIRRDISDSSLSELSTQSNPAALPSSGRVPKFYPYFISSRNHALTQHGQPQIPEGTSQQIEESGHIRKRSSSFTESGSMVQKPVSRRDPYRTLTRSKTHYDSDTITRESVRNETYQPNGDIPVDDINTRHQLFNSQSANELQPPMFDTNLNICRQYLSRSQGQLAQNNAGQIQPTPEEGTSTETYTGTTSDKQKHLNDTNANAYRPISANNSNNKLNFGQIYQRSKSPSTHDNKRLPNSPERSISSQARPLVHKTNVPKSNSLDSILDHSRATDSYVNPDSVKNYAMNSEQSYKFYPSTNSQFHQPQPVGSHQHQRSNPSQVRNASKQSMSILDRDKFNNEAFEEIQGMGWVPSLDDYGSRASVAESLPAKSKKEDIMELLQQHIAHNWVPKRTPSTSSTNTMKLKMNRALQAKIRTEMMKEKESDSSKSTDANGNTWEAHKQNYGTLKGSNQTSKSNHTPVVIFAHKQPPPSQHNNHGQRSNVKQQSDTDSDYSKATIRKGYVDQNGYITVNAHTFPAQVEARNLTDTRKLASGFPSQGNQQNTKTMQKGQGNSHHPAKQPIERKISKNAETDNSKQNDESKSMTKSENGALVIQATRTSPNGHKVSVFTVTKSAPNTPVPKHLPASDSEDDGNEFFSKRMKKAKKETFRTQISATSSSSQMSHTNISDSSTHSHTDVMQAMAIEAARVAQVALGSSSGSLDKFQPSNSAPPLPLLPPNSNIRSSTRGRSVTGDFGFHSPKNSKDKSSVTPGRSCNLTLSPGCKKAESGMSRIPRSRSKNRRDRESSAGRTASPATTPLSVGYSNGVLYPVKDLRSGAKTPTITQRMPSPTPVPKFQRTLSTPIRTKTFALQPNGGLKSSSKNTKTTGMYNEPVTGTSARSRPPAAPRSTGASSNSSRLTQTGPSPEKSSSRRPVYQIGQSGTLPRNTKSAIKIERSGSITGSMAVGSPYLPNRRGAQTPQVPGEARNMYGRQYIPTPRKDLYKAMLGDEELKYKRSLSETWKQPSNLVAVNLQQQHHTAVSNPPQSHQHQYHHMGHQGMMPTTADPRTRHEPPRRTASADDLLWSDGRDPASFNVRAQQGTLV